jgi:hypothetical protein
MPRRYNSRGFRRYANAFQFVVRLSLILQTCGSLARRAIRQRSTRATGCASVELDIITPAAAQLPVQAVVSLDELVNARWHVAHLQMAAAYQLLGDICRHTATNLQRC